MECTSRVVILTSHGHVRTKPHHISPFQIGRLNQNLNFENVLICVLGYINNMFLNNSEMLDIRNLQPASAASKSFSEVIVKSGMKGVHESLVKNDAFMWPVLSGLNRSRLDFPEVMV